MTVTPADNLARISDLMTSAQDRLAPARDGVLPKVDVLRAAQTDVSQGLELLKAEVNSDDMFRSRNGDAATLQAQDGRNKLDMVIGYLDPEPGMGRAAVHFSDRELVARVNDAADHFGRAEQTLWME